jgi:hypothetical protein
MLVLGVLCILAMIGVMFLDRDYENVIGIQLVVMLGTVLVLSIGVIFNYL